MGSMTMLGYRHTLEAREKIRLAGLGREPWNKGKKMSVSFRKKLSDFNKRTGKIPPSAKGLKRSPEHIEAIRASKLGKPRPLEVRKKMSKGMVGKQAKEKHWNWKGGISKFHRAERQCLEYKEWRRSVFRRDRWACVFCGYRSKSSNDIHADHIKRFSDFPELRYNIENGRTLCVPCHLKITFNKI